MTTVRVEPSRQLGNGILGVGMTYDSLLDDIGGLGE